MIAQVLANLTNTRTKSDEKSYLINKNTRLYSSRGEYYGGLWNRDSPMFYSTKHYGRTHRRKNERKSERKNKKHYEIGYGRYDRKD